MEREIKFRAFENGVMMYRGLFDRNWYTEPNGGKCIRGIHPSDSNIPVMQYTGVKDKNGKEIYEGDILKEQLVAADHKYIMSGHVVGFHKGKFMGFPLNKEARGLCSLDELDEVIGNEFQD